ncbi:hypothetical protein SEVIR_1G118001v4 [Setaria viridis]
MKSQADKLRTEREFQVNDLVYLKLQPYNQTSVASRSNQKLSFKFYGPFKVLQRVGSVAYKLDLPVECRIHPVVHVSQLKKHVSATTPISSELPSLPVDSPAPVQPVALLDHRLIQHGSTSVSQVFVQWDCLPAALATWEEITDLHRPFPDAPAWGQAGFCGGGSVMALRTCARRGEYEV